MHGGIGIEWSTRRGASAHRDGPLGFGHLIVNATDHRTHFQSNRAGDDDQIALTRTGTKNARAESIDIKTSRARGDHLDGATRQTERHGPKRRLARPVHYRRSDIDGLRADSPSKRIHDRIDSR